MGLICGLVLRTSESRWIPAAQKGLVSWDQLRDAGLEPKSIRHRVASRRLHVIHDKVYSVGRERLTQDERFMAGVLAGGLDARS